MAIEDIIWAKNRHMFGGIEPNEVQDFSARIIVKDNDTNIIRMMVTLPDDTVVNGQTLCSVSGVIVRGSLDDYPEDETSGIDFGDYSESGEHDKEWDITGKFTLYLSAFAYSDQGVINRNARHATVKLIAGMVYHFGYDLDLNNRDPDTRVSYPDGVYNYGWGAADANSLSYWSAAMPFSPKPCVIDASGNVLYYLQENDYTKEDTWGETIQIDKDKHFVMMQWPKIYTKRWEENGVYHFRCSDTKVEDDYECWCNYDANNNEIDYFYTAVYLADSYNAGLSSCGGTDIYTNRIDEIDNYYYPKIGVGWSLDRVEDNQLILDLLTMIFKTTDLSSKLTASSYDTVNLKTGLTDQYGMFSLKGSGLTYSKVFGMEHFFGVERWIENVGSFAYSSNSSHIGFYYADIRGKTYSIDNPIDGPRGYIKEMQVFDWGRLPSNIGGSELLDYCSKTSISAQYGHSDWYRCVVGSPTYIFGYYMICVSGKVYNDERRAFRLSFKPQAK